MDAQTSINGLFNGRKQFCVPNYQRAYAWRVKQGDSRDNQVNQFLDDIKEQNVEQKYYLGHFLFELIDENDEKYAIIDGQQRITTIVIFMGCLIAALKRQNIETLDNLPLDLIADTYLEYHGQKFSTVSEDLHYFQERILKGNSSAPKETNRKSELCIKQAADYFDEQFRNASIDDLARWFRIINTAQVTTYCLKGRDAKVTATQIFSFQNDRGKDLTKLEQLKAYIMHQSYKFSGDYASSDIEQIDGCFSSIYSNTEELIHPEDTVLGWHCQAFLPSWEEAFQSVKTGIANCPNDKKRDWILDFVAGLRTTFKKMVEIEKAIYGYSSYIADICYLDKNNTMPLLIKLAHFEKLEYSGYGSEVLKLIEQALFKLTFTMGGYRTNSFISIAKDYKQSNFDWLLSHLRYVAQHGFQAYWDFTGDCRRYFEENCYHYDKNLRYVLYKYENSLRTSIPLLPIDECSNIFKTTGVQNTLDHITPEHPDFTEYSEDFKNRYLCNLGNLSLLVWCDNSRKNNHEPYEQREIYNKPYLAQKKVHETLCSKKKWMSEEISDRRMTLLRFIFQNWELGDVSTIKELEPEKPDSTN